MNSRRLLLLDAKDAHAAILSLYRFGKASNAKWSLAYIAKKANISSTGYLSDVLKGKRVLHPKYQDSIGLALGLNTGEAEYLSTLIALEHTEEKNREQILKELQRLKKLLQLDLIGFQVSDIDIMFSVLLMSAFTLFKGNPTGDQLVKAFGKANALRVKDHLRRLLKQKIISTKGEGYQLDVPHLLFAKSENHDKIIDFLSQTILNAGTNVKKYFSDFNLSNFTSTIIGVNRAHYLKTLNKIKSELLKLQLELENSHDADMLIHFNIQIYPCDLEVSLNNPEKA